MPEHTKKQDSPAVHSTSLSASESPIRSSTTTTEHNAPTLSRRDTNMERPTLQRRTSRFKKVSDAMKASSPKSRSSPYRSKSSISLSTTSHLPRPLQRPSLTGAMTVRDRGDAEKCRWICLQVCQTKDVPTKIRIVALFVLSTQLHHLHDALAVITKADTSIKANGLDDLKATAKQARLSAIERYGKKPHRRLREHELVCRQGDDGGWHAAAGAGGEVDGEIPIVGSEVLGLVGGVREHEYRAALRR